MKEEKKTIHNNKEVLAHWNDDKVESMYDKFLISAEIELILSKIKPCKKILDAGCGEGEGTALYCLECSEIHAVDFSETRLKKASERLFDRTNVILKKVDFLGDYELDKDYDYIISQRFLINLIEWELQQKVILDLCSHLRPGGRLLMLEGSVDGVNQLNKLRKTYGLDPIPVKWHNLFFENKKLKEFLKNNNLELIEKDGLGDYFFLTRGIRPCFDKDLDWQNKFNEISASKEIKKMLGFKDKFSRLQLWVIEK